MTIKSERIFFAIMVIMAIVLLFSLSSCAILDKMRIPTSVPDVFITTPSAAAGGVNEKNF